MSRKKKKRTFTLGSDIVHGICPYCKEHVALVAIVQDFYRCSFCGEDTEQKINGVIKYIPIDSITEETLNKLSLYCQKE